MKAKKLCTSSSICRRASGALLVIALCAISYFKCGDDAVTNPDTQFCITGTITNWTLGAKTLHAYVRDVSGGGVSAANCPIDAQGNFNLCLPATLSDTLLFRADSIFYQGCHGNVTFNPPDTRGTQISSFKVKNGDTVIGYIQKNNYDTLYVGAFSVGYVWVNKDMSASGDYEYCFPGDTLRFSGSITSGWDKIVKNCTRTVGSGTSYLYNTTEPPGAVWEYRSYFGDISDEEERHSGK